jgi:hypothetical protein
MPATQAAAVRVKMAVSSTPASITFNFVKLGFDETDGEQRGGDGEADADSRLPKTD